MSRTAIVLPLILLAVSAGCASNTPLGQLDCSLNRPGFVTPEESKRLQRELTDDGIAMLLDANVRAKLPTPVALAHIQTTVPIETGRWHRSYSCMTVRTVAPAELQGWEKAMADTPGLTSVRLISPMTAGSEQPTLHRLRSLAAQMNCELLLVCMQADGSVDNLNDAAALYWTGVGLWTVPGNVYERKTVMQAAVVDCRTGVVLGTAAGQASEKTAYAAAYEQIAHDKLEAKVPAAALADLQKNSVRMFAQVVVAARGPQAKAE